MRSACSLVLLSCNRRAGFSALLAAGALASTTAAQELVTFHWSFGEVNAGTTVPVANPDGFVGPGEAAELRLTLSFTPDVGQPITYTPPPPPGHGVVGGLAYVFFDLEGGPTAQGTFSNARRAIPCLHCGGIPTETGLLAVQVGQIAFPEVPLQYTGNPIVNALRLVWTPADYTTRVITFTASKAAASTTGTGASIYVQYGGTAQEPLWTSKQMPADFGTLQIPIIPSPPSLTLLAMAGAAALRRRR